ncbi:MAG: hypothetical protein ABI655_14570 [Phenylobacterium sp.]
MAHARALLVTAEPADPLWSVLAASAFFAFSAVSFATAMVLAPPVTSEHVVRGAR